MYIFYFVLYLISFCSRISADDIKSLRVITAVKTPYLPDGRFDLQAYDSLINMQIDSGVDGVIVGRNNRRGSAHELG
jgi:4-hydroxy-tetrahydrodipicolinate synthase